MINFSALSADDFFYVIDNNLKTRLKEILPCISNRRIDDLKAIISNREREREAKRIYGLLSKEVKLRRALISPTMASNDRQLYDESNKIFMEYSLPFAIKYIKDKKLTYESFVEFFGSVITEEQFEKCRYCDKLENCNKGNKCLDIEDVNKSSCEQALEVLISINKNYVKEKTKYNTEVSEWQNEYDDFMMTKDRLMTFQQTTNTNVDEQEGFRYLCSVNSMNPNYYILIRTTEKDWKKYYSYKYSNTYIQSRLRELEINRPRDPPQPPKWGDILCNECKNVVDINNVESFTDSQIQLINQCVINSSKKSEPKEEPKESDIVDPPRPATPPPTPREPITPTSETQDEKKSETIESYMPYIIAGVAIAGVLFLAK